MQWTQSARIWPSPSQGRRSVQRGPMCIRGRGKRDTRATGTWRVRGSVCGASVSSSACSDWAQLGT
eukprot:1735802-Rhodomonas_salina.1